MTIIPLLPPHWPSVKTIYEAGLATGNASFQTSAPGPSDSAYYHQRTKWHLDPSGGDIPGKHSQRCPPQRAGLPGGGFSGEDWEDGRPVAGYGLARKAEYYFYISVMEQRDAHISDHLANERTFSPGLPPGVMATHRYHGLYLFDGRVFNRVPDRQ